MVRKFRIGYFGRYFAISPELHSLQTCTCTSNLTHYVPACICIQYTGCLLRQILMEVAPVFLALSTACSNLPMKNQKHVQNWLSSLVSHILSHILICRLYFGLYISNICSLGPRPTPFWSSVCVHNNTRERKTGQKWGRPGSIHHVNDVR